MGYRALSRNLLFVLILLSLSKYSLGQEEVSRGTASMNSSIDIMFGSQYLRKDTLDNYLSDQHPYTFSNYARVIGISWATTIFIAKSDIHQDAFFTFQYQFPNIVRINDSLEYSLTGYQIGIASGRDLFYANKTFDLIFAAGVQFGGYYLTRNADKGLNISRTKNGVIAPQIIFEARYFIGNLKIGLKTRVQYDISNTNWNTIEGPPIKYGGFSAVGIAFQIMMGYKLN